MGVKDFFNERWKQVQDSLDRRIDNEIVGEYMPSPTGMGESGEVRTTTIGDERGRPKVAGDGGRIFARVPDAVVYISIALVGGVALWRVLK